jgi:hypothetical protein
MELERLERWTFWISGNTCVDLISFPSELMTTMMDLGSCLPTISTLIPTFGLFPVMLAGSK